MVNLYLKFSNKLKDLVQDESGATVVEYSVMIGLLLVGIVALTVRVGAWMTTQWNTLCVTNLTGC